MKKVHIGEIIKNFVIQQGVNNAEFARRISVTRPHVSNIYKNDHIDTVMLQRISEVLKHDFFQYYTPLAEENELLKRENELLKKHIQFLNAEKP